MNGWPQLIDGVIIVGMSIAFTIQTFRLRIAMRVIQAMTRRQDLDNKNRRLEALLDKKEGGG